jgi:hypothetical protein
VAIAKLPDWVVTACASVPSLLPVCTEDQPPGTTGTYFLETVRPTAHYPYGYIIFDQGSGAPGLNEARPPAFSEVVEATGPVRGATAKLGLSLRTPARLGQKVKQERPKALNFGARDWGGRSGRLVLTRSSAGQFANLLAFTWHRDSQIYVVAVGVWTPITEAAATLRAIVDGQTEPKPLVELSPSGTVDGIDMTATPQWVSMLCHEQINGNACPSRIPTPAAPLTIVQVVPVKAGRSSTNATSKEIDVAWGGGTGSSKADKPPTLVHLVVSDGDRAPSEAPPARIDRAHLLDNGYPRSPLVLGHPEWAGHHGTLTIGDCFGDHVCYRWRSEGRNFLISMHAWSPLTQTLAVLARVVTSGGR